MLLASMMFILGSLCFFGGLPFQVLEIGEILFIVASLIYVLVGVLEMFEMCHTAGEAGIWGNSAFHEQMAYLVSATVFAFGTVLYWPGIYGKNKDAEAKGVFAASWCFILGSLGFVIASFWNAIQLSEHPEDQHGGKTWNRLTKMSLFFSIMGGVLFVTGSYLFSLDVENACGDKTANIPITGQNTTGQPKSAGSKSWCLGVTDQGTVLFVIGSVFYTISSMLNCAKLIVKRCVKFNKHGYCEVSTGDDADGDSAGTDRLTDRDFSLYEAE